MILIYSRGPNLPVTVFVLNQRESHRTKIGTVAQLKNNNGTNLRCGFELEQKRQRSVFGAVKIAFKHENGKTGNRKSIG